MKGLQGALFGVTAAGAVSGDGTSSGVSFGENPYYYDNWCGHSNALTYLDDKECQKKFPTSQDRDFNCPLTFDIDSINLNGYEENKPLNEVKVDTTLLPTLLSGNANICVILTRRSGAKVYNKYFCNGEASKSPFETWSSSKIFTMANAASSLRTEDDCAQDAFGLDASTTGKHGKTPLGDLSTIICSYDSTMGYSSNSLSSYFHDLGWRDRAHSMVTTWLGQESNSLGGNYGEATPADLGMGITAASGQSCQAAKDPWKEVFANSLSAFSAAEFTRRIVQFRDLPSDMQYPNATFADMQNIMYGAKQQDSQLFPTVQWGGMTADISIFLQSALDMTEVQQQSNGQWRIFSKLGAGFSSSRLVGEITNNAYACLPSFNSDGSVKVNAGFEFTISVRGSVPGDASLVKVESVVHTAVLEVVAAVLDGKIA